MSKHHQHRVRRPLPRSWAETSTRLSLGVTRHLSASLTTLLLGRVRLLRVDVRGPAGWQVGMVSVTTAGSTIAVDEALSEAGALSYAAALVEAAAALAGLVGIARRLPQSVHKDSQV